MNILAYKEGCMSGLNGLPAKEMGSKLSRRFESFTFRFKDI